MNLTPRPTSSHGAPPGILDLVSPYVFGILWVTKSELKRELPAFNELNYLFDGLISQYLYGSDTHHPKKTHMFFTLNFAQKLCLVHIESQNMKNHELMLLLKEEIKIMTGGHELKAPKNELLLLNQTEHNLVAGLSEAFPQFSVIPYSFPE